MLINELSNHQTGGIRIKKDRMNISLNTMKLTY